jgi:signal transduction histidine kinase
VRAYVAAMGLVALGVVAYSAGHLRADELPALLWLFPMAVVAGRVAIPLPRGGTTVAHTLVYFPAVLVLSTPSVVLLVAAATLTSQLWTRQPWYKTVFNTGQHAVSKGAASAVWVWLTGGDIRDPHALLQGLPWVGVVGAVYFALNAVFMSTVLVLHQGGRPWETWRANKGSVLLPQLAMYFLATLFVGAWLYDPRAILLLLVPAAVVWVSFRQVRALEAKTATEQELRAETERLAARWEKLASASQELAERIEVQAVLRTAADLTVLHCADAARVWIAAGGRSAAAARPGTPRGLADPLLDAHPADPRVLRRELRVGNVEVGRLEAAWASGAPSREDEALLDQLADRIAAALQNAVLLEQAAEVEAVREVTRMKNEFLSAVSHELRSPLALLIGYGELLAERSPGAEEVRWMGERIHRASEHLARLVDDLLEAGRLESGRFSLDLRPVDPVAVASAAVEAIRVNAADHRFVVRDGESVPRVQADATRLQQILTNLLSNAVRYAPAGTEVAVSFEPDVGQVVIAVEDEGPGVPVGERTRVFDKFYRTPQAQALNKKGLGLGLSICRDLVVAHRGRIWVEDAPGGGARFVVVLPVAPA